MDPDTALLVLLDACKEAEDFESPEHRASIREVAIDACEALADWIRVGGFLPDDPRGDE